GQGQPAGSVDQYSVIRPTSATAPRGEPVGGDHEQNYGLPLAALIAAPAFAICGLWPMSALGQKQTFKHRRLMSAFSLPISEATPAALLQPYTAKKQRRSTENRLAYYNPYPKQIEFLAAGAKSRERLLMAGNQIGKTLAGGFEAAMHATGRYPDWWKGRRFDR